MDDTVCLEHKDLCGWNADWQAEELRGDIGEKKESDHEGYFKLFKVCLSFKIVQMKDQSD